MTQQTFPELANKIRLWLSQSGQAESPETKKLCTDLEHGVEISRWAAVNFERVLPFRLNPSILEAQLRQYRSLLVFLPIALTWFSIFRASMGFRDYVSKSSGETVNFLVYWESQNLIERLSTVALIDAVLVLAIIVMSFVINQQSPNPKRIRALESLHTEVMIGLERELAGYRYLSVADLHTLAQSTVDNLSNSSTHIATAANAMDVMSQKAETATKSLESLVRNDFTQIASDFSSAASLLKTIGSDQQQLSTIVATINNTLSNSIVTLNSSVTSSTQKLASSANELTSHFEGIGKELQAITRSIELSVMHLKNDLDDLKKQIRR